MAGRSPTYRRLALVLLIALVVVVLVSRSSSSHNLAAGTRDLFEKTQQLGPLGPLVVGALFIPVCLLFLPGSPVTLFGGFAFGKTITGFLAVAACVSVGSTTGAALAFLVGRTLLRDWVRNKVASSPRFRAIDSAVGHSGFKIVLLSRLSPVFPFNLLNYAFGLTAVSFRDYVLGSWLGMLPGTILFVYLGATLGDLAEVFSGQTRRDPAQQAFFYGGLVLTLLLAIFLGRVARRAIATSLPADPPP